MQGKFRRYKKGQDDQVLNCLPAKRQQAALGICGGVQGE